MLEEVREHLRCGTVYDLDFGRYRGYEAKGWRPHVKYRVSKLADLREQLVPFFRHNELFGHKRGAFELFAELVELISRKDHLNPDGLKRAKDLARKLTEHNRKGQSGSPDARDVLVRWERERGSNASQSPPVTPRKWATPEAGGPTLWEGAVEGGARDWGEVVTR